MSNNMQWYFDKYGESHQNKVNKTIHWICVPAIMFSILGLFYSIPFLTERTLLMNWAAVFLAIALVFYLTKSITMFIGFILVTGLMLYGNHQLFEALDFSPSALAKVSFALFVIAWIGQFIGHKIEGKKPSFLDDLKFLMIGPAWLLHFIYKKVGIPI